MAKEEEQLIIALKSLFDDDGFKAMSQSLQTLDKKVKEFEENSKKLEKTSLNLENIGNAAKKMQLFVTAPLAAAGTAAVMGASKIESFTATFTTMLGNEDKAEKLIGQLNRMASITPFDPEPLIQSSKTLLAYQVELEDIESTLKMLGDASSGSAESLQSLSVAYGKIATKGKASMEELNIMIDRGIPILEYLGRTLDTTGDKIIEMTSKGEISFEDVNKAFQTMTSEGGVFYNGMATASETLAGKTSTLKGNIDLLMSGLAEGLLPIVKQSVDALNSIVVGFQAMDESTKAAVLSAGAVAAALPPIITAVSAMTKSIKAMTVAMKAGNLAALANPYTAIGIAITAIVAGLAAWIRKQKDLDARVKDLAKMSEKTAAAIEKVVQAREAEKEATESGTSAQKEKEEVIKSEIEFQKKLEAQLKKTAAAAAPSRRELYESEKSFNQIKEKIEELNKLRAENPGAKVPDSSTNGKGNLRRIDVNSEIEYQEQLLEARAKQIQELKDKIAKVTTELTEDVATALRANLEVEDVLLRTNDLTKQTGKEALEQAKAYNEELKKRAELEKEEKENRQEQQEQQAASSTSEKEEKDRYEQLEEIYRQYTENREKIESSLLRSNEAAALEAENTKNEALYQEYLAYLQRREEAEKESERTLNDTSSLHSLESYLDKKEDLVWGYYADYQEYLGVQADADKQYYEDDLETYIQYLQAKLAAGKELSEAEASALGRLQNLEDADSAMSDTEEKLKKLQTLGGWLDTASRSFVSNLETGNVAAEVLGANFSIAADACSDIVSNIADSTADMDNANGKTEMVLKSVAAGLEAIGDIAGNIFAAVTASLDEQMQNVADSIAEGLETELSKLEKMYEEQTAAADEAKKASLESLKDEYAQRGIIIETGLESELEKAQSAYDEALQALEEYEDETTSTRQAQLDAYKEQLAARNDEDIQQALEAKQRELEAVDSNKKAELQKNADTKKAELEKQKILEDAEKKKNELEKQYQYDRDLAEYNAECDRLTREHELQVQQFNIKKAQDIASIWIAQAAGIATIWATAMQLGPIAGPIAAAALSGTMATVAGVQTGLVAAQSPPAAPEMPLPPAKYMTGGVIPGNDNQDRTLLLASSGERVLTQEQNALFERFVQSMEAGAGSPVVNVQVYIDGDEINIEKKIIDIQKKDRWSGRWGM